MLHVQFTSCTSKINTAETHQLAHRRSTAEIYVTDNNVTQTRRRRKKKTAKEKDNQNRERAFKQGRESMHAATVHPPSPLTQTTPQPNNVTAGRPEQTRTPAAQSVFSLSVPCTHNKAANQTARALLCGSRAWSTQPNSCLTSTYQPRSPGRAGHYLCLRYC